MQGANSEMGYQSNNQNPYGNSNVYMTSEENLSRANNNMNMDNQNFTEKLNQKGDIEQGVGMTPLEVNRMMRMGFIRKVYGILSIQLLMTVALMCLAFVDSIKTFLQENMVVFWIAMGLSLVIIFPLICFRKLARGVPQNYILLFLWTLCESYMLATAVSFYDPRIVMLAGVMTLAVTVSLTVYACTTKTDFTFCGGLLFCLGCIMLCWSIFSLIWGVLFNTLYCVLGLLLYSVYLIYDTQLIMGKFGREFNIDDYIYAALTIYLDIIQIFLYILQILGRR